MKKKQKVNSERDKELFTKVYHQYKIKDAQGGEQSQNDVKHIPTHLANNPHFMRKMNMFKAEELEGSVENFQKKKDEYKGFLSGVTDTSFLMGLKSQEVEIYRKEMIDERIKELNVPKKEKKNETKVEEVK